MRKSFGMIALSYTIIDIEIFESFPSKLWSLYWPIAKKLCDNSVHVYICIMTYFVNNARPIKNIWH